MPIFRKLPVTIEAITFDQLVQHGLTECAGHPDRVVNGMPWSFHYKGHPITHENDDCYCIPTLEGMMHFKRGDMLITGVKGEIYPCKPDIFSATYEEVPTPRAIDKAAPIMRFFKYDHLPAKLQTVSRPLGQLAEKMEAEIPDGPEKSAGLRKLLEAKDCLVRAALPV